jgi:hypothetical protein
MFFASNGPADSRSDQPREFFAVKPPEIELRSRLELGGSGQFFTQ